MKIKKKKKKKKKKNKHKVEKLFRRASDLSQI